MTQQYPPYPPQGDPQWSQGPIPPPVPPQRKPKRSWPKIALICLAVLAVLGACSAILASNSPTPTSSSTSSAPATRTTADAPVVQDEPDPEPSTSGPLTTFSDGTYEVGTGDGQVEPGKYKSPGGDLCSWQRLKNNDGALGDIIDIDVSQGQSILNVKKTDGYIQITGCTFTKA